MWYKDEFYHVSVTLISFTQLYKYYYAYFVVSFLNTYLVWNISFQAGNPCF